MVHAGIRIWRFSVADLLVAVLAAAILFAGIFVRQNVVGLFVLTYGFPIIALGFYVLWAVWPPVDRAGRPTQFRVRLLALMLALVAWNWFQVLVLGRSPMPKRPWQSFGAWAQIGLYVLPMGLLLWLVTIESARAVRWLLRRVGNGPARSADK